MNRIRADCAVLLRSRRPWGGIKSPLVPIRSLPAHRHINRYGKAIKDDIPSPFDDPNHPIDDAISRRTVHLVTPQGLLRNQSLNSILLPLNPKEQNVRQVSVDDSTRSPIVKVVSRKELQEQYQAAARLKRRSGQESSKKELELNWAIDRAGDLHYRLKRLKEWLAEGKSVEVLLAHKVAKRRSAPADCEELVELVRSAANEVDGVVEGKEMDGKIGSQLVLSFRPSAKAGSQIESLSKVEAYQKARSEKKAKREQEKQDRRVELEDRKRRKEERDKKLQGQKESQKAFD